MGLGGVIVVFFISHQPLAETPGAQEEKIGREKEQMGERAGGQVQNSRRASQTLFMGLLKKQKFKISTINEQKQSQIREGSGEV